MVSLFLPYIVSITDFSISPRATAFQCVFNLTFSKQHVLPLSTLPLLQRMEYTPFLVILSSVGGLTRKRYSLKVEQFLDIVLWIAISFESFRPNRDQNLPQYSFPYVKHGGKQTVVSFDHCLTIQISWR